MVALGSCGQLNSSSRLQVNELITVAIGSTSGSATALAQEFDVANEYVNFVTGSAPGATLPGGYYASTLESNTLADAMASCINTAGNTGSSSNCSMLFQAATPPNGTAPSDTVGAMLNIINGDVCLGADGEDCDGGAATSAQLNIPYGVAVGANGDIVIADTFNNRVRKVTAATGVITTVAGNGTAGYNGDGIPGASAELNNPKGVAIDVNGDIYIGDNLNYRVRRVSATTGIITTVAGNGARTATADGVAATATTVSSVRGIAIDASGNLYLADYNHYRVRKVSASTGLISTIAGTGVSGYTGDGGAATSAQIGVSYQIAVDPSGNVYFGDVTYNVMRRIDATTGVISTIAGTQSLAYDGNAGPAIGAHLQPAPDTGNAVATDSTGNVYFTDYFTNTVREVSAATGLISIIAGTGVSGHTGDGGAATSAQLSLPSPLTIDANNNLYFYEEGSGYLRKVVLSTGIISTVAGGGNDYGDATYSGVATGINLSGISGLTTDPAGNVYLADPSSDVIRKLTISSSTISTIAGNGQFGNTGDGGAGAAAEFENPFALAADKAGNVYVADPSACVVRRITAAGVISTVAGNGTCGFAGDAGPAVSAELNGPVAVSVDASGNLYIGEYGRIRKVTATSNAISTVVGNGTVGYAGDGGQATQAEIGSVAGLAFDSSGNLSIGDFSNGVIRVVYH